MADRTSAHVIVTAPARPGAPVVIPLPRMMTTTNAVVRRVAIARAAAMTIGDAALPVSFTNARGMAARPPARVMVPLVPATQKILMSLAVPHRAAMMIPMQMVTLVPMNPARALPLGAREAP